MANAPVWRGKSVTVIDRVSMPYSDNGNSNGMQNYVIGQLPDGSRQYFKIEELYNCTWTDSVTSNVATVTQTLTPKT